MLVGHVVPISSARHVSAYRQIFVAELFYPNDGWIVNKVSVAVTTKIGCNQRVKPLARVEKVWIELDLLARVLLASRGRRVECDGTGLKWKWHATSVMMDSDVSPPSLKYVATVVALVDKRLTVGRANGSFDFGAVRRHAHVTVRSNRFAIAVQSASNSDARIRV